MTYQICKCFVGPPMRKSVIATILTSVSFFVDAVGAGAIIGKIKTFTHVDGDTTNNPVLKVLPDSLCR